jgi:class 3 adenylate cyclase
MSTPEVSLAPGTELLHFRLISRLGDANSSVWKAEDTRNGKNVALKILSRRLPQDPVKRDALVQEVRVAAALHHTGIAAMQEIVQAGDMLVMVMELVEGQPISRAIKRGLPNREQFFRVAFQLADVLNFLHGKGVIHSNISGDDVILLPSGQVKVSGFNLSNLVPKSGVSMYEAKANDARAVAYMSPEQVTNRGVDLRTDLYSCGVVFYEMSTGKLPFTAGSASELASKIPSDQPANPKAYNPEIDPAVLALVGRCLFKDPFRRPQTARQLIDEIKKADPDAAAFVARLASSRPAATTDSEVIVGLPAEAAPAVVMRRSILFLAELAKSDPSHDDPAAAAKSAARMQQILGEAVYLFDGQVVDPFGPRLVAEIPSASNAAEVARKAEFDLSEYARENKGQVLQVTMLLHCGDVAIVEGKATGPAVDEAAALLDSLPPGKVLLTDAFRKQAQLTSTPVRPFGEVNGVKLYEIPAPEVEPEDTSGSQDFTADTGETAEPEVPVKKKKAKRAYPLVAAVVAIVVAITGAYLYVKYRGADHSGAVKRADISAVPTAANPRHVALQPFTIEGSDPLLTEQANAVRLTSMEILRMYPELRVDDAPTTDSLLFTAKLVPVAAPPAAPAPAAATGTIAPATTAPPAAAVTATAGTLPPSTAAAVPAEPFIQLQLVPSCGGGSNTRNTGAPVMLAGTASGVSAMVSYVLSQVKLPPPPSGESAALEPFSSAVSIYARQGAGPQMDAPLHAAMAADPHFLPAHLFALRVFRAAGNDKDAAAAAAQVLTMQPSRTDALEMLARWNQANGDIGTSLGYWKLVLQNVPNDVDALNTIGHYAVAVNDVERFNAIIKRVAPLPLAKVTVHAPDILLARARVEAAINLYYDVEVHDPNNPALALKIGRLSVLRHTLPIADLELEKLSRLDPDYGYHLLKAYLATTRQSRAEAEAELKAAKAASKTGDDYYSSAAEVYAMLADDRMAVASLEIASQRKEPTISWLLSNPLFNYLQNDPAFQKVAAKLQADREEIQAALAQIPL